MNQKLTECERILAEKILPPSFFESETRSGFFIGKEQKKVWAVELDLLRYFDDFCKKHDLKYFLMYGSLLGAVRHKGFIPWDDDVDVGMPRKDYEKLLSLGDEIKEPYFLQTPYTDDGYFFSFSKLRNSNTSGITKLFAFQRINWGIMIDIFPIDTIEKEKAKERYNLILDLVRTNSTVMRASNPYLNESDKERVRNCHCNDPLHNCKLIQELAMMDSKKQTDYVSNAVFTLYGFDRYIFKREHFKTTIPMRFEGFLFPVPIGYDYILTAIYGDYTIFPPVEKRGLWHNDIVFDADVPYAQKVIELMKELAQQSTNEG